MSTKGGILVGDGSGAPSVLSVGDDDYVLTADSSQATGVKWAASAGAVSGNTFATDLKIGRDSDNHIDFTTDNQIHVNVNNGQKISVKDNEIDVNVETNINDNLNVYGDININSGKLIMPDVTAGKILVADGTSYQEVALSGDATIATNGALTIANDAVQASMLNDDIISGQSALDGANIAQGDEFIFSHVRNNNQSYI